MKQAKPGIPELHFDPAVQKPMSQDVRAKGEAFVQALVDEGHSYDSMKANFAVCIVVKGLTLSGGVVDRAAGMLKAHRNQLFDLIRSLSLRTTVAEIRANSAKGKAS